MGRLQDVAYATLHDPAAPDPPPHAALAAERFAPVGTPAAGAGCVLLEPARKARTTSAGGASCRTARLGGFFVRSPMMFTGIPCALPALTAQRLLPVPPELRAPLGLDDGAPALVAARAHAAAARRQAAEETEEAAPEEAARC